MHENKNPLPSRRRVLKATGLAVGAAAASTLRVTRTLAASYPDHPVKIVVPFAPAGPTDIMARILAQNLGEALGGNVIVENRPGASGNIGIGYVAHAEADGYTLLVSSSAYVVNPSLFARIPYDPFKDFAPITELGTTPNIIVVSPKLGISSIAELFARARAKPDELNYASPGAGTTPHLSAELLKIVGGVQITHVPFSGAAPAIQALLAGTTQMAVTALPAALPFVQSGELKALALTGEHRWIDLPNTPTMIELGYKDFVAETAQFFFAPAKTPSDVVATLATKSMEVLKKPDVISKLRDNGYEVVARGSQALSKYIESEVPKWRDVIAKAGIKPV